MDQGIYHMVGDNETWFQSRVHLVFATTELPDDVLLKTLLRRIPIIITVPSVKERPLREKKELIRRQFMCEEQKIGREVSISRLAYYAFLHYSYPGNIGQLENMVKVTVANALVESDGEKICIHRRNLPVVLWESVSQLVDCENDHLQNPVSALPGVDFPDLQQNLFLLCQHVADRCVMLNKREITVEDFLTGAYPVLEQYIDALYLGAQADTNDRYAENLTVSLLSMLMEEISWKDIYNTFLNNEIQTLAKFLIDCEQSHTQLEIFSRMDKEFLKTLNEIGVQRREISHTVTELFRSIKEKYLLPNSALCNLILHLFISYMKKDYSQSSIPGIIIAHGHSVAEGIAEWANHVLGAHIFDGIALHEDTEIADVVPVLLTLFDRMKNCRSAIVLVDYDIKERLLETLSERYDMDIGIVDNVTTKQAIEIGRQIVGTVPLAGILESIKGGEICSSSILKNAKKRNILISINKQDIATENKVSEILAKSIPNGLNLRVLSHNQVYIPAGGDGFIELSKKYNIIAAVGIQDGEYTGVPFLTLEELIMQQERSKLDRCFAPIMDKQTLEAFYQNIVRCFSLWNLSNYLNVMDSSKIISDVEYVIYNLQQELSEKFSNGTILGLYIHIGCLIEQLVVNKTSESYGDLEDFRIKNREFVDTLKTIFKRIEAYYSISIPDAEIAYLHDFIYYKMMPKGALFFAETELFE
jgi:sigma-54 dependent transcriptional regulator of gfr operon